MPDAATALAEETALQSYRADLTWPERAAVRVLTPGGSLASYLALSPRVRAATLGTIGAGEAGRGP